MSSIGFERPKLQNIDVYLYNPKLGLRTLGFWIVGELGQIVFVSDLEFIISVSHLNLHFHIRWLFTVFQLSTYL